MSFSYFFSPRNLLLTTYFFKSTDSSCFSAENLQSDREEAAKNWEWAASDYYLFLADSPLTDYRFRAAIPMIKILIQNPKDLYMLRVLPSTALANASSFCLLSFILGNSRGKASDLYSRDLFTILIFYNISAGCSPLLCSWRLRLFLHCFVGNKATHSFKFD